MITLNVDYTVGSEKCTAKIVDFGDFATLSIVLPNHRLVFFLDNAADAVTFRDTIGSCPVVPLLGDIPQ